MVVFVVIAVFIAACWAAYTLIGFPLVAAEKVQDYRKDLINAKEKRLWKAVFIIWSIIFVLLAFIFLASSKN